MIPYKIGQWTITSDPIIENHYHKKVHCVCTCGFSGVRRLDQIMAEKHKDCRGHTIRHGLRFTYEYNSYRMMLARCFNPKATGFKYYGGRGITVCPRWMSQKGLENFISDMGERPTFGHSLDRINNDGNYEPLNCRWATASEQGFNKKRMDWSWDIHGECVG
jgi:hypothetical protein